MIPRPKDSMSESHQMNPRLNTESLVRLAADKLLLTFVADICLSHFFTLLEQIVSKCHACQRVLKCQQVPKDFVLPPSVRFTWCDGLIVSTMHCPFMPWSFLPAANEEQSGSSMRKHDCHLTRTERWWMCVDLDKNILAILAPCSCWLVNRALQCRLCHMERMCLAVQVRLRLSASDVLTPQFPKHASIRWKLSRHDSPHLERCSVNPCIEFGLGSITSCI